MSGVYDRPMFKKPARAQLDRFGGIMASSKDLLNEAHGYAAGGAVEGYAEGDVVGAPPWYTPPAPEQSKYLVNLGPRGAVLMTIGEMVKQFGAETTGKMLKDGRAKAAPNQPGVTEAPLDTTGQAPIIDAVMPSFISPRGSGLPLAEGYASFRPPPINPNPEGNFGSGAVPDPAVTRSLPPGAGSQEPVAPLPAGIATLVKDPALADASITGKMDADNYPPRKPYAPDYSGSRNMPNETGRVVEPTAGFDAWEGFGTGMGYLQNQTQALSPLASSAKSFVQAAGAGMSGDEEEYNRLIREGKFEAARAWRVAKGGPTWGEAQDMASDAITSKMDADNAIEKGPLTSDQAITNKMDADAKASLDALKKETKPAEADRPKKITEAAATTLVDTLGLKSEGGPGGDMKAIKAYYMDMLNSGTKREQQEKRDLLLGLGAALMAGTDPNALVNFGNAFKGMVTQVGENRKEDQGREDKATELAIETWLRDKEMASAEKIAATRAGADGTSPHEKLSLGPDRLAEWITGIDEAARGMRERMEFGRPKDVDAATIAANEAAWRAKEEERAYRLAANTYGYKRDKVSRGELLDVWADLAKQAQADRIPYVIINGTLVSSSQPITYGPKGVRIDG